jgi:acyl-CoA reductase-like NAD-dependent aldehyde dehydrogenase
MDGALSGAYYPPTLMTDIDTSAPVWREEVFGPILPIVKFATIEEAIELANDTPYGLGAYVFTESRELFTQVAKELKTGMVQMNTLNYCTPENPFGGYKSS